MSDDLVNSLQELADVLQTQRTLGGTLASIAEATTVSVPGCDAATIAISIGGRPATAAMTATVALELDLVQYDNDDGPCLTSFRTANALRIDLYEQGDVFPHVAIAARRVGIRAVLVGPVDLGDRDDRHAQPLQPVRPLRRERRDRRRGARHAGRHRGQPITRVRCRPSGRRRSPTQLRRPLRDRVGDRDAHRQPGLHPRASRRTAPTSRRPGRADHLADRPTHHRTAPQFRLNRCWERALDGPDGSRPTKLCRADRARPPQRVRYGRQLIERVNTKPTPIALPRTENARPTRGALDHPARRPRVPGACRRLRGLVRARAAYRYQLSQPSAQPDTVRAGDSDGVPAITTRGYHASSNERGV